MEGIKKLYEKLNTKYNCGDIVIEDFTPEQVFYQMEDLFDIVIKQSSCKLKNIKDNIELNKKHIKKEQGIEDDTNIEKSYENVDNSEEMGDSVLDEQYSDEDSFIETEKMLEEGFEFENEYDESFDEDTLSDEGDLEVNCEEYKDIPAKGVFKILDKNIKKK